MHNVISWSNCDLDVLYVQRLKAVRHPDSALSFHLTTPAGTILFSELFGVSNFAREPS